MVKLKYIIEDKTIAEVLGVQNFNNKESAVLELVKNAYDAGATQLEIHIIANQIIIKDNGCGMNESDIKQYWMRVGYSDKGYEFKDENNELRVFAGSKGIGRFALSRLGANIQMYSKKNNEQEISWQTDWETNILTLTGNENIKEHGTTIEISNLRDKWAQKSVENLRSFLSRTYNSTVMSIKIFYNQDCYQISQYFDKPQLGINCLSYFDLNYNSETLELTIDLHSDEFLDEAIEYCENIDLASFNESISMIDALKNDEDLDLDNAELTDVLTKLGSFNARMFFSLKGVSLTDADKFLYKHQSISNRYEDGIVLYRNAFSISSYEGKKDWLEFGKRSRKSPAAASHPTGSWRVRENQISGYVNIDKRDNPDLKDLSNRQGLEENIYYNVFIRILQEGIEEFEEYRQTIIRKINKKNAPTPVFVPYIDRYVKNPEEFLNIDLETASKIAQEIVSLKNENKKAGDDHAKSEERYRYDVRILNTLSTIGLKSSSIAHELQNDRNDISSNCGYIISAMKKYKIWDIINREENTKKSYENIPQLLESTQRINHKIIRFIDTILANIEKDQFAVRFFDILPVLNEIKNTWEREYSWISIQMPQDSIFFTTSVDIIKVILDNLILNSIQQNDNKSHLDIIVEIVYQDNKLIITYGDNGKGLPPKYRTNPRKILNVHETSRKNGHGLGMWIVNNTLVTSGGGVIDIPIEQGFKIIMELGENND